MSYSYGVRAKTKADAIKQAGEKFAEVVQGQPMHEKDRALVAATTEGVINLLKDDPAQEICASVSGSVSWQDGHELTSANVNVSAWLARDAVTN